jgi:CRP/FNR family transcriptional regulator
MARTDPHAGSTEKVVDIHRVQMACAGCSLRQLCLPMTISETDMQQLEDIIRRARPHHRGRHVFRLGDRFRSVYAIRSGSVKTYTMTLDGSEQITGFHLPGELIGLDAVSTGRHPCAAKTLETTTVCELPFTKLEDLCARIPSLQHQLLRLMSKEILADSELLTLLGKKAADQRLAALLFSLSVRYKQRGFSAREFHLSMSRNDIADYLGLAVETVSRLFTRFHNEQLIEVQTKRIRITDPDRLRELAGVPDTGGPTRSAGINRFS